MSEKKLQRKTQKARRKEVWLLLIKTEKKGEGWIKNFAQ